MTDQPTLHVIAGPNGAGKSTFCVDYLPAIDDPPFMNADVLAATLSPGDPNAALFEAGRLLLRQIDDALTSRTTFALETTLSGRGYLRLLRRARAAGYYVEMNFIWVRTADQSVDRVAQRVERGGHSVPETDIRRRHAAAIKNFFTAYIPLVNEWTFRENSEGSFRPIAMGLAESFDESKFLDLVKT